MARATGPLAAQGPPHHGLRSARPHQRGHLVSQQEDAQMGQEGLLEIHPSILEETVLNN